MEAKDKKAIQQEIARAFPGLDMEMDIDWEVAEISFKLGLQEVVDWLKTDCGYHSYAEIILRSRQGQAQLKKWNISA